MVNSLVGLPNGDIVTGSTGRQEGNQVAHFKIRLWREGRVVKEILDIGGGVKQLGLVDMGFFSIGNDGSVRVWSYEGDALSCSFHPSSSNSFLLGLNSL